MDKKIILIIVISLTMMTSCFHSGQVKNKEWDAHPNLFQLQFSGITKVEMDSETSGLFMNIQFVDVDDQSLLISLNPHDNSLRVYDMDSLKQIKKIVYEKQGGDGVGVIHSFFYYRPDSIFIYSYWDMILFRTNEQGKVLEKYPFKTSTGFDEKMPIPFVQTSSPMQKINNEIVMNGFILSEVDSEETNNMPFTTCYNLKTRQLSYINRYPEQYSKYHWGGGLLYRLVHHTVNRNNEMILSFAADHRIFVYSFDDRAIRHYYGGSSSIKNIKSTTFRKGYKLSREMQTEHYLHTPSYEGIFHDPYRNVYYRIARLPIDDSIDLDEMTLPKPVIVIVLNGKFEYIGETNMPKNIDFTTNNCFVTKEGLHIQVFLDDDDEDHITFYTLQLAKR